MATTNGDFRVASTGSITASAQVYTGAHRLAQVNVSFPAVATPKYPLTLELYDGTDATGVLLAKWEFDDASASTPDNLVSGDFRMFGSDEHNDGSGYPLATGLWAKITQGGTGTNNVAVVVSALIRMKA